jgi:hypothetical protein
MVAIAAQWPGTNVPDIDRPHDYLCVHASANARETLLRRSGMWQFD